ALVDQRVDGILLARMSHQVVRRPVGVDDVPVVLVDAVPEAGWRVPAVAPDEAGIAATAVGRLLDAGHRRIAFASTVDDAPARHGREAGFLAALAGAGIDPSSALVVAATSDTRGGREAGRVLLDRPQSERPTGVFCFNDQMAMGVAQAAATLGLDIPGDVSLVGVDDLEIVADALEPGLTTVALPHRELGAWGMRALLGLLDGDGAADVAGPTFLSCELVERASVAPPR
ncbi:MAG TPA: substrate-binding domain-containing protein, partial [Agromyces sp.]|nr:substrate-binding domain-containing protein [Agromyces sp.]